MKYIFLDIETAPIKIENEDVKEYLMDKRISREDRSLNPLYAKIIAIGLKAMNGINIYNGEEKEILEQFWSNIGNSLNTTLVTYNGYKFDIPFIILRSIINKVKIPFSINLNKWQMEKSNHFDLMLFFSQHETFINPNLRILGKMYGIESDDKLYGYDIERLYKEGKIEEIKKKCQNDIEVMEKLFLKFCKEHVEAV